MAAVARTADLHDRIDRYLSYLIREWASIPEIADEWDEWDDLEQLEFTVEWPIREDRLGQLQAYAEQGLMTPAQQDRYDELLHLVEKHRPTLERLIGDD